MSSNEQCGSYSMPALEALFIETQPEDSWYPKHHTTKKQWSSLEALQLCTWTKVKRKQLRLSFSPKPNLRLLWEDSLLNHLLEWGHYKLSRRIHDTVSISRTQCKIYKLNIYIVHVSVHIYIYIFTSRNVVFMKYTRYAYPTCAVYTVLWSIMLYSNKIKMFGIAQPILKCMLTL